MSEFWMQQFEYLLRIAVAAVCGAFIGMERKHRLKGAGVRTHLIVALASALMTVVSKYGFFDVTVLDSVNLDPSRVAAGVVSAIGFLGAGVIFMRNQSVIGITTAGWDLGDSRRRDGCRCWNVCGGNCFGGNHRSGAVVFAS